MSTLSWRFPILDDGEEQGINDGGITAFKGSELYDNLAREICQNSLDARDQSGNPVTVEFISMSLKKADYPSLRGLDDVFKECAEYWKEKSEPKLESFLGEASAKLAAEEIDILAIRDYNTTGLGGARASIREKSVWRALTHSSGVTNKEAGSAGSYGIGKNAPFACSSFRTIFYNSYASADDVKAFQGVARLVTHEHDGNATQGVGFFQNTENKTPIFPDDDCSFRDKFCRDRFGTDVIIAGFKKTGTWVEDIEKAVIKNFFVALSRETLVVKIADRELNAETLPARLRYYADKEKRDNDSDKKITTVQELYSALTVPDKKVSGSIIEKDDVELYIKKDDSFSKTIAEMRSIGMTVRTRRNNIFARYAAVMIVTGDKLNELLKNMEPPQHNKWDPGLLEDLERQKKAREYRTKLVRWTNDKIIDFCKPIIPDEFDLEGISAYLPFDDEDMSLKSDEGRENTPGSRNAISGVKSKRVVLSTSRLAGERERGTRDEDNTAYNNISGGGSGGSGGIEDPDGQNNVIVPKTGEKEIDVPKPVVQRIMQVANRSDLYRAVIMLEKDCDHVHIAVKALGDDNGRENVTIKNYKTAGQRRPTSVNSNHIGPIAFSADTMTEVFFEMKNSEKMVLQLSLY